MYNIGHVCFQIPLIITGAVFIGIYLPQILFSAVFFLADMFDPGQKHVIVKGLEDIIIGPKGKGVLCDLFLSYCRYDDKCRVRFSD